MYYKKFLRHKFKDLQRSLWGSVVITSLASALPIVGSHIVSWLWGGFSVDNPTLNRFYSFHYRFPFILAAASIVHLAALHHYGSTNPLGITAQVDLVEFYPYFYVKDLVATLGLGILAAWLVGFEPELLGHPDNNIPANPYSTPAHIVPEWYFLWVYAILRSIPNKLAGVAAIALVFITLAMLPYRHKPGVRSPQFRAVHQNRRWCWFGVFVLLTYRGHQPVEPPYVFRGQFATVAFFVLLGAIMIVAGWEDRVRATANRPRPNKF